MVKSIQLTGLFVVLASLYCAKAKAEPTIMTYAHYQYTGTYTVDVSMEAPYPSNQKVRYVFGTKQTESIELTPPDSKGLIVCVFQPLLTDNIPASGHMPESNFVILRYSCMENSGNFGATGVLFQTVPTPGYRLASDSSTHEIHVGHKKLFGGRAFSIKVTLRSDKTYLGAFPERQPLFEDYLYNHK